MLLNVGHLREVQTTVNGPPLDDVNVDPGNVPGITSGEGRNNS
jgi:hypothetical protein